MELTPWAASWFLPFVTPICIYVAYMDMKSMRIPNPSVVALFAVFAIVGLVALPFDVYLWRYVHLVVALLIGMGLNAGGLVGAGDAKFVAAAAPSGRMACTPRRQAHSHSPYVPGLGQLDHEKRLPNGIGSGAHIGGLFDDAILLRH